MSLNYDEMTIDEVVEYIEKEMQSGRSCKDIEINDFGVTERTIRKRLARKGIKIDTKKHKTISTTEGKNLKEINEIGITQVIPQSKNLAFNETDMTKLKYYVDNFELIKSILEGAAVNSTKKSSGIQLKSRETTTTSLRINKELYEMVKARSKRDNIGIGEILNRALIDYLNNYI